MTQGRPPAQDDSSLHGTMEIMAQFATAARVTFDRGKARRLLHEAKRAIPGDDPAAWSRRLVEVGESIHLKVRMLDSSLDRILGFVEHGTPVAHGLSDEADEIAWAVLIQAKGSKVLVMEPLTQKTRWVSRSVLRKELALTDPEAKCRWIVGQPALSCQSTARPTDTPSSQNGLKPLARVISLFMPERKDLWILLIFSSLVGLLAFATPVAVEVLVNTVAFGRYLQPIIILAMLLFVFLAFAAAMRGLVAFVAEVLQRRIFIRVVEDLAYRLPRVQQSEFDAHHGPELTNRFFDVVTVQKATSTLLLDGLVIVLQTIIGMSVLAFYHPFLLGYDIVLLLLITVATFLLGRGAVKTSIKESKAKYAVAAWLQELARHTTAFKMNGGQAYALERADNLAVHWLDARRAHFQIILRQILFVLGLQAVAGTALLGLGGWLVISGEMTLGQLVASELIVMMLLGSFAKLGKHLESYYDLLASVDKLGQLFDLSIEQHDRLFHLREGEPADMRLKGVSVANRPNAPLSGLELEIKPGESTAIYGDSGAGKSSILSLLSGLRQPTSGIVEIDGIDIRELRPDSLREHIALAGQIEIFHGSIQENIHLNRAHINAKDVRDALETVELMEDFQKLPDGLNTELLTHGRNLTGSQATRLMIARAIVGRPRVLLLDSVLDSLSDAMADRLLARLKAAKNWTLVVATSRSRLAEQCNRQFNVEQENSQRKFRTK
ncbi:peptidase domain-containing ABC transporter [Blastopirellula retiformator]|uniref:Alpha-hemolysin translocation ATP-binding protein HlyB n=1 Tax=Blastopirellula retiformator TaxID=2527970 RepID=A0A5C5VLL2_9BACT|nr:ATP-binding cassette domain-containing protein [Blastopirellula retiformator]TWT38881.1 Alpha-hemolysin translocation ATP-binding protein HlyB [Blastopirellula retiformator]